MRLGRVFSLMILAWLFVSARSECERTRNVFVLFMENSHLPANIAAANAIQEIVGRQPGVQVYEEYLDEDRLGTDFATVADMISRKYAGRQMDLIMTIGPPTLRFVLQYGEQLWPAVPKVFSAVVAKPEQLPEDMTGVYNFLRFAPTLDLALQLQPDTQHVFYIGGISPSEIGRRAIAQTEFKPYEKRVDFTYLNDVPLPLMFERLSMLPVHSIVLFTTFFKDASGESFISANVAPLVVVAANAPVYGTFDTIVGSGIVGGNIYNFEAQVRQGALMGLKILRGQSVANLPMEEGPRSENVVDWRQIKKWKIPRSRIPAGTIVMYRELTVWERYRDYLWLFTTILVAQSGLIILLLAHVRARQRSNVAIRRLTTRLIYAGEDERKRVASELHDDIGQRLSLISLQLDSLAGGDARNEDGSKDLKDCLREVDSLVTDVHNLSHELHSSKLEHLGLESALRELCRQIGERHNLQVNLDAKGVSAELQRDISLCFYRVAQEALNNIVRHSGATRAEVRLNIDDGSLRMVIRDFGGGFVAAGTSAGLGLVTMEERLRTISGTFSLSSKRGTGTTVTATAPLSNGSMNRARVLLRQE